MGKIELRNQRISDAKRFYRILTNPNFIYFTKPKSLEAEKKFLKQNSEKRKKNTDYNYAILCDKKLIGGCGIKINQHQNFIGEIGYFVDESYWRRGIASKAVKLLEKIGFTKLKLSRIEIRMNPKNKASVKVAIKCGYKKEGKLKKAYKIDNIFHDLLLYAKVK